MNDSAWWWVKASNLEGLSGPVVRYHLAHVEGYLTLLYGMIEVEQCSEDLIFQFFNISV